MTYIRFFFVLYWFAPFLKFGPLPSGSPRCALDIPLIFNIDSVYQLQKHFHNLKLQNRALYTNLSHHLKCEKKIRESEETSFCSKFVTVFLKKNQYRDVFNDFQAFLKGLMKMEIKRVP